LWVKEIEKKSDKERRRKGENERAHVKAERGMEMGGKKSRNGIHTTATQNRISEGKTRYTRAQKPEGGRERAVFYMYMLIIGY